MTIKQVETIGIGAVAAIVAVLLISSVRHQSTQAQAYRSQPSHHNHSTIVTTSPVSADASASVIVDGQPVDIASGDSKTVENANGTTTVSASPDGSSQTVTTTTGGSNAGTSVSITSDDANSTSNSTQFTNTNSYSNHSSFSNTGSYQFTNGNVSVHQSY